MDNIKKLFKYRFGPILLAIIILCAISFVTRFLLLLSAATGFDWTIFNVLKVFIIGGFFDIAASAYAFIPLVLFLWLMPKRWHHKKWTQGLLLFFFFLIILVLLFNAISEWFFWQEFSVRYNFIAVDYLVYTTEVIGNIRQSYPINTIIVVLLVVSGFVTYLLRRLITQSTVDAVSFLNRSIIAIVLLSIPTSVYFLVDHKWRDSSSNQYVNELSGNGLYDFGFAFWHNQLDYNSFYLTLPTRKAFQVLDQLLHRKPNLKLTSKRQIAAHGAERKLNVVLISVESLSAEFLESFGNQQKLTPNLDSLAHHGLLFTQLYASGTRTVRGLEALSLCIPPTPGQSIVKRPNNKKLFTMGNVFKSKGYHSRFIYGGYGYFDNMNEFFSQNGYEVTDRKALKDQEIHYANIWGVADEDLFTLSLRELDKDYQNRKPFFAQIMTVSNHRPYTYPEGRIDIPSHTSREGAVKYTDYAIGKFIKAASAKPWFDHTLFVIVADHCASSAGKVELPVDKYHIPMIFYAPKYIKPGKFEQLTAQIDIGPTVLGFLNFNYQSKFFGQDVFHRDSTDQRALISTYQSLGYIKNHQLVILDPNKKVNTFQPNFKSGTAVKIPNQKWLTDEAVATYQTASYLYQHGGYGF